MKKGGTYFYFINLVNSIYIGRKICNIEWCLKLKSLKENRFLKYLNSFDSSLHRKSREVTFVG